MWVFLEQFIFGLHSNHCLSWEKDCSQQNHYLKVIHAHYYPFTLLLIILTDWLDIDDDICCAITFRKLYNPEHNIFLSLRIHHNGSWKLTIDKTILDTIRCTLLRDLPKQINCVSDVVAIFKVIDSSHLCYGNLEPKFCSLQIKSG